MSSIGCDLQGASEPPGRLLRGSTSRRLPWAGGNGRALSCFAAPDIATQCAGQVPGAGTLRLWLRVGLPSHAAEPPAVSPCGPQSPSVSSGTGEPARGFAFYIYSSGISINPDVSTETGCPVAARFIARKRKPQPSGSLSCTEGRKKVSGF